MSSFLESSFQGSQYVIERTSLTRGPLVVTPEGTTRTLEETYTFEIKDNSGSLLAKVTSKGIETGGGPRTFSVATPNGEPFAELRKNVLHLGDLRNFEALKDKPAYEAFDSAGQLFAAVRHKPSKPDSRFSPQVPWITDAQSQGIVRLDYGGFLSKQWSLKSDSGSTIATIHVQILPRETYSIAILSPDVKPYMILIPFFGLIPEPGAPAQGPPHIRP